MSKLMIGLIQYNLFDLKTENEFWMHIKNKVAIAKKKNVQVVVFPEYVTAHLLSLQPAMTHDEACSYLSSFTEMYLQVFRHLSESYNIHIVAGTHITRENEEYYNTAFLFYPNGRIESQYKIHLTPEEREIWKLTAGSEYNVFQTDFGKIAILTCYDIEFPEGARIVADQGAQLIICPSYTDSAAGFNRVRLCSQARAIENQMYVALCGIVGKLSNGIPQIDKGYSGAGVYAPCDNPFPNNGVLALGKVNKPLLITYEIDFKLLEENRNSSCVSPYLDRRQDIYDRYKTILMK